MIHVRHIGILALWLALLSIPAAAHVTATGLAVIAVDDHTISYRLTVVPIELPQDAARLLTRAAQGDRAAAERLAEVVRQAVVIRVDGEPCRPGRVVIRGSDTGDLKVTLEYGLRCAAAPGRIDLEEHWDPFGPHYSTIVTVMTPNGRSEHVLSEESRQATVHFGDRPAGSLLQFIRLGVEHILTGYDHLLFLLALLVGVSSLWRVLYFVTAFTLAHSITLSLAVLGLVHVPGNIIEPLIAASIVWVAVENVLGRNRQSHRLAVAFLFGLVHGLGFADALSQVSLAGWPLVQALVGFNAGVEVGQAVAIGVALPVLLGVARLRHAKLLYRCVSFAVAVVGAYWFVDRTFIG